jgi:hypothetical protein
VGFLVIGGLGCESCMQAIRGTDDSLKPQANGRFSTSPKAVNKNYCACPKWIMNGQFEGRELMR